MKKTRAPRCQRRPTEEDFSSYPIGARVSVFWGSAGRINGVVVGRSRYRLRVLFDHARFFRKHINADGSVTVYDCQPSPLTVRLLQD